MFLYLSKLLPLFFYPLGFACICCIIALFMVMKRPRVAVFCIAIALFVLLFSSNAWVSRFLIRSLEWQNIPSGELPAAEAIVVLGGATKSVYEPRTTVDLSESGDRVLYAAQLYRQQKAPLIIVSGGRIDWRGGGLPESEDIAKLLIFMGVKPEDIIQEPDSLNTYENAVNVKKILLERNIDRILLVTSAMHMPRSLAIFQHQKIEAIAAPTDFLVTKGEIQELANTPKGAILNVLPDSKNLDNFTIALKEYIGMVVYRLRGWV
ncbi:MAG: YdcF family protein [Rivularia sp. T60_A2020_040]|nr:YdcF family protein [Rivularia sp. T60_A2020_040]